MGRLIGRINEALAVRLTRSFGTMWVFYTFMVYGLLPMLPPFRAYETEFLYWSNWIQLCSFPLIMVGTNILGRAVEVRAQADHEKLVVMYDELITMMAELKNQDEMLSEQSLALRHNKESP